jgi:hypothetical protein
MSRIQNVLRERLKSSSEYKNPGGKYPSYSQPTYQATVNVYWAVEQFMELQYGESTATPLGSVITLSGSALHAQAATCRDYLERNWPLTGQVLLKAMQSAMGDGLSRMHGML